MSFGISSPKSLTKANGARKMANFAVFIRILWVFVTHYVFTEMLRDYQNMEIGRSGNKN